MRKFGWLWMLALLVTTVTGWAQDVPARPDPPRLVNDLAGVLLGQRGDRDVFAVEDAVLVVEMVHDSVSSSALDDVLQHAQDFPHIVDVVFFQIQCNGGIFQP